ncbi:MAG: molecular chaperone GrpE [Solirubrobacteraceae bacterium]|jgi:molecular chaperone GrpE|nr:molecular chaperone GrpE [Solirubrobacteraceae bacterium]
MPSSHGSNAGDDRPPQAGQPGGGPTAAGAGTTTPAQPPGAPPGGEGQAPDGGGRRAPGDGERDAELARLDDRYKRALADLDNYRKRTAREIERRVGETRETLLREWLEALDSVERALRMDAQGPLAEGLRAVLDQMESILARQGVQRIGQAGERFDPERHDAVDVRVSDDVPDRTVLEVVRSGWALGDRVLRPAQVVVSRAAPPPQSG